MNELPDPVRTRLEAKDSSNAFCIVGAGPSGLVAARAFRQAGFDVEILERHTAVGGLWDMDNPNTPLYESCNFISDKAHSGFIGYPMPAELPDFPRWDQVRDYIRGFATSTGLADLVQCDSEVISAEPVAGGISGWRVTLASGETRLYRGVVWACGQQQTPYVPTFKGQETFRGKIIHSGEYRDHSSFVGQRVLVVGAGNSGVDIVCDAAMTGRSATLSMRRAYWFFPKRVFGYPVQGIVDGSMMPPETVVSVPRDPVARAKWVLDALGDYERLGLPIPTDPVGSTHGISNDQVAHYLTHGRLGVKPDIDRLEGEDVVFVDGSRETIDLIVLATGYSVSIPWLDPELLDWVGDQPDFHLGAICLKAPGLYSSGILHFGGGFSLYKIWEQLAYIAVADARARVRGDNVEQMRRVREEYRPDLKSTLHLVNTHRNLLQVDAKQLVAMFHELRDTYGIDIPEVDYPATRVSQQNFADTLFRSA